MHIVALDHVQLAIPPDGEPLARAFWTGPLGFREQPKPEPLRSRGGLWLHAGSAALHLGLEAEFRPAKKAHPAFVVQALDELAERLIEAGSEPRWDRELPDVRRFFVDDPFGNRLEFDEAKAPIS